MRRAAFLALSLTLPLLAACASSASTSPRIQTSSQANRANLGGAVSAPMRDLNVLRTKIPAVLLEAMADPYAKPVPLTCARLTALLLPLNGALGADLDEPPVDEDDLVHRGQASVLGYVAGAASDVIPFRGWVRKLSGAEQHDSFVSQAITSGAVRRAYLKGLGEAHNCPPPATASHVPFERKLPAPPPPPEQKGKPRYPVR